jgi:hypothetical protein
MFAGQSQLQYALCPHREGFTEYPLGERRCFGQVVNPTLVIVPIDWLPVLLARNHELAFLVAITDTELAGMFPSAALFALEPSFEALAHELTSSSPSS